MFTITNFNKFNSVMKYPSIETYHMLDKEGKRGLLLPELTFPVPEATDIIGTEKLHGTNTRITVVLEPDGYDFFIGSREEWLTAKGDRVYTDNQDSVKTLYKLGIASDIEAFYIAANDDLDAFPYGIYTVYGEVYGGNINQYKWYTASKKFGFRVFDISYLSFIDYLYLEAQPIEAVSQWRTNGGQHFLNGEQRSKICDIMDLQEVPYLFTMHSEDMPQTREETYALIKEYGSTKAGIDAHGESEGIVFRTDDRKFIAKAREEDYRRSLNPQGGRK